MKKILCFFLFFFSLSSAYGEWVYVKRVIDGDTFVISDNTRVRVMGIDTPETKHPVLGEEAGGKRAEALARSLLEGKKVWLDGKAKDKYGRRLARVRLADNTLYADIVRANGLDKLSSGKKNKKTSKKKQKAFFKKPAFTKSYKKVYVKGYYRKDGTYVKPHWRKVEK